LLVIHSVRELYGGISGRWPTRAESSLAQLPLASDLKTKEPISARTANELVLCTSFTSVAFLFSPNNE
jgi:hypothetical protein